MNKLHVINSLISLAHLVKSDIKQSLYYIDMYRTNLISMYAVAELIIENGESL